MLELLLLSPKWTPLRLGASLLAWWDAERIDRVTQSAGLVSHWRDIVGSYDAAQASGSLKPTYSATSFNSRPGITFDGVDDYLQLTQPATLPTGAGPGEIWALVDQTALVADTGDRGVTGYYDGDGRNDRRIGRVVSGGTNRARVLVGDASTEITSTNASVDLSGRHVLRAQIGATSTQIDVDGTANGAAACVPSTGGGGLLTIGRRPTSLSQYWSGAVSAVIYTAPLSAGDAVLTFNFLNLRR